MGTNMKIQDRENKLMKNKI